MSKLPDPLKTRTADHPIETIFLKRWSPRAMTGEAITRDELNRLFEAARWAPSTYNEQNWRFLFAHRDTPQWPAFLKLLMEANQVWCKDAGVLVVALSKKTFTLNGKPNPVYTLATGAAFENLALQGAAMNLVVHGMAGFSQDAARKELKVPDDFAVEAMIAIGRPGDPDKLPEELRKREQPTDRMRIGEFTREGVFSF